jgi:DNA-binding transcriptional LysR family regulator
MKAAPRVWSIRWSKEKWTSDCCAPVARPQGMRFVTLAADPLLLAISKSHPLAIAAMQPRRAGAQTLALAALRDEPFILVRRPGGMGIYSDLLEACEKVGFRPRIAAEVENMLTNIALVAAGVGVSAVPASMQFVHRDEVLFLAPREKLKLNVPLTLAYMETNPNPVTQRFLQFAKELPTIPAPKAASTRRAGSK